MSGVPWTPAELQLLEEKYRASGTDIPELLERHSAGGIKSKASELKFTCSGSHEWTPSELKILNEKYGSLGSNIPELLERHTALSIKGKASRLGLTVKAEPDWTQEEIDALKVEFPVYGVSAPSLKHRTAAAIRTRASILGLYHPRSTWKSRSITRERSSDYDELQCLATTYGFNLKRLCASMRKYNLSKKELLRRLPLMHIERDGTFIRTVYSFVLSEDNYFTYEGHLWSPSKFCEVYNPKWTLDEFQGFRKRNGATSEQVFQYLQFNKVLDGFIGRQRSYYSEEEDEIIRSSCGISFEKLCRLLPWRTPDSIITRARSIGVIFSRSDNIFYRIKALPDVSALATAYKGTDGKTYYFVRCALCGRVLLMREDTALAFTHKNHLCSYYEVPSGISLPWAVQSNKEEIL